MNVSSLAATTATEGATKETPLVMKRVMTHTVLDTANKRFRNMYGIPSIYLCVVLKAIAKYALHM